MIFKIDMTNPLKSGFMYRYRERLVNSRWEEYWVTVFADSSVAWFDRSDLKTLIGHCTVKEVPHLFATGRWSLLIPNRPRLPRGYSRNQVIAVAESIHKVYWLLAKSEEEAQEWTDYIIKTLPQAPIPLSVYDESAGKVVERRVVRGERRPLLVLRRYAIQRHPTPWWRSFVHGAGRRRNWRREGSDDEESTVALTSAEFTEYEEEEESTNEERALVSGGAALVEGVVSIEQVTSAEGAVAIEEAASAEGAVAIEEAASAEGAVAIEEAASAEGAVAIEEAASAEGAVAIEEAASAEGAVAIEEAASVDAGEAILLQELTIAELGDLVIIDDESSSEDEAPKSAEGAISRFAKRLRSRITGRPASSSDEQDTVRLTERSTSPNTEAEASSSRPSGRGGVVSRIAKILAPRTGGRAGGKRSRSCERSVFASEVRAASKTATSQTAAPSVSASSERAVSTTSEPGEARAGSSQVAEYGAEPMLRHVGRRIPWGHGWGWYKNFRHIMVYVGSTLLDVGSHHYIIISLSEAEEYLAKKELEEQAENDDDDGEGFGF